MIPAGLSFSAVEPLGFIGDSSPAVRVTIRDEGGRVFRISKTPLPPLALLPGALLSFGTREDYPQNLHHGHSGLGDYRAGGYAEVSSGRPPAGPQKEDGPALVSQMKVSRPGLLPYQRATRRRIPHSAYLLAHLEASRSFSS
jgi:hypothetical protein